MQWRAAWQEPNEECDQRDRHADHEDALERALPLLVAARAPHELVSSPAGTSADAGAI
jgi:hypothetical protein